MAISVWIEEISFKLDFTLVVIDVIRKADCYLFAASTTPIAVYSNSFATSVDGATMRISARQVDSESDDLQWLKPEN